MNAARPELNGVAEVELRCRRFLAGVIEYDEAGIPRGYRRRCKDYECCPRRDGHVAIHVWTIYGEWNGKGVGEYITEYMPYRPASELLGEP